MNCSICGNHYCEHLNPKLPSNELSTLPTDVSTITTLEYKEYTYVEPAVYIVPKPQTKYEVDFDKVNNFEDMKRILKTVSISFHGEETIKGIEDLVKVVSPSECRSF